MVEVGEHCVSALSGPGRGLLGDDPEVPDQRSADVPAGRIGAPRCTVLASCNRGRSLGITGVGRYGVTVDVSEDFRPVVPHEARPHLMWLGADALATPAPYRVEVHPCKVSELSAGDIACIHRVASVWVMACTWSYSALHSEQPSVR